ncbi:MAG: class 1 isoprenoid biosynthesis enzyme [Gemmatimonadota bacterium]
MTLSPVFRSPSAVLLLQEEGIWERLGPAVASQARAVRTVHADLGRILDPEFLAESPALPADGGELDVDGLPFLQEYFFLILFRSLFESLGVAPDALERYAEINFCIKGTITAADNLFDEQAKSLLPLRAGEGSRFMSILQLMCFERLIQRALDRGIEAGHLDPPRRDLVLKGLLDMMARIGRLEGSEEGGVDDIPAPGEMVEQVHRVRGGALFALAFVAPSVLEEGEVRDRLQRAEPAVARLGTAFQIVDDLTDFEFDVGRRSHNLLVAQVHHHGTTEERSLIERLWRREAAVAPDASGLVEGPFQASAHAVLERAYVEARASFRELRGLGFWFPDRLADDVVHAIVGLDGVRRMETLSAGPSET